MQEERSADEAAVNLLEKTNQSFDGMLAFMKRINQQNTMSGRNETPYFRTHPVTRERISFFEEKAKNSKIHGKDKLQDEFEMVKAKLYSFLQPPHKTFKYYPTSNKSKPATYAHSIAYFKQLNIKMAIKKIDELIALEPYNPYFKELKAQIYMETGDIKNAKTEYKNALDLLPNSALFQVNYAQAILESTPNKNEVKEAISLLNKATKAKPSSSYIWILLARAYDLDGNKIKARYAAAEFSVRLGNCKLASRQAKSAKKLNPTRKTSLKLDDIIERCKKAK